MRDADAPMPPDPVAITARLGGARRILIFGAMGAGKSTLARGLAMPTAGQGRAFECISADPGSPDFGPPGAVALGRWREDAWHTQRVVALCSLDAARFRLPLAQAVAALAGGSTGERLVIDAPGVTRGAAGSELLAALIEAAGVDAVLVLLRAGEPVPLASELAALVCPWIAVAAHPDARRPAAAQRARQRTLLWDRWLAHGVELELPVSGLAVLGMPPPRWRPEVWVGRQVALLPEARSGSQDATVEDSVMAEIRALRDDTLTLHAARLPGGHPRALLVRDVVRGRDGLLATARHRPQPEPPPEPPHPRRPSVRLGPLTATLVNGVFGDALVHLRLRFMRATMLFDLGETERLSPRELHDVSDVFISHAHFDHVAGFLRLLRARLSVPGRTCRLYGPEGTARRIAHLVDGIHWDRIGEDAPVFEVVDIAAERLRWTRVQPGRAPCFIAEQRLVEGLIVDRPELQMRVESLDHRIPVLAYALSLPDQLNVRRERLDAMGFAPGPWLGELKRRFLAGERRGRIALPDGSEAELAELAGRLLLRSAGAKLVYATDLDDSESNRRRLIAFARQSDLLWLESTFLEADRRQAERTQHLTARACGEIARAAEVHRLAPFHFSKRYESDPEAVYREIETACSGTRILR